MSAAGAGIVVGACVSFAEVGEGRCAASGACEGAGSAAGAGGSGGKVAFDGLLERRGGSGGATPTGAVSRCGGCAAARCASLAANTIAANVNTLAATVSAGRLRGRREAAPRVNVKSSVMVRSSCGATGIGGRLGAG